MQNPNHNVLDTNKVGRLLIILSTPIFFGALVQSVYSVVDTVFVGQYVGSLGIAGLSIVMSIQTLTMGVGSMLAVGGSSLISRLIGAGKRDQAERALGNSIFFILVFSAILMLIILPGADFWLKLIGASKDVLPFARDYLVITTLGTVFNIGSLVIVSLIRAEGNTRVGMISVILQSGLNIVLDAVFIIALGMGVKGAALAMVISQAAGLIYAMTYYLLSGKNNLKIRWRNFIPDWGIVKSIFSVGVAQLVANVAVGISMMILVKVAVTYGGDIAISAFGITQRILGFAIMPGNVLGQAMQPILGYNYGAKRYHLVLKTFKIAILGAEAFNVAAFLVLFFFPDTIIRIFTSDPQSIAATTYASRRVFLIMPVFIYNTASLVFPSIGKAVDSFFVAIARPVLFLTPLVLLLSHYFQIDGVWLAFPGADILGLLFTASFLIPLIRKLRKAAAAEQKTGTVIPPRLAESAKGN